MIKSEREKCVIWVPDTSNQQPAHIVIIMLEWIEIFFPFRMNRVWHWHAFNRVKVQIMIFNELLDLKCLHGLVKPFEKRACDSEFDTYEYEYYKFKRNISLPADIFQVLDSPYDLFQIYNNKNNNNKTFSCILFCSKFKWDIKCVR